MHSLSGFHILTHSCRFLCFYCFYCADADTHNCGTSTCAFFLLQARSILTFIWALRIAHKLVCLFIWSVSCSIRLSPFCLFLYLHVLTLHVFYGLYDMWSWVQTHCEIPEVDYPMIPNKCRLYAYEDKVHWLVSVHTAQYPLICNWKQICDTNNAVVGESGASTATKQ